MIRQIANEMCECRFTKPVEKPRVPHATCRMVRRLRREADKSADMVEMEESEQVGVGAGAGEGQDKDVVLNRVEQQPVIFDVAITESSQVSSECMVMILRRQGLPGCKDADNCFKLGHIGAPLEHLLQFLSEFLGANDVVFHDSRNSLSFAGSLQRGVVGSCAMRLASSKASSVSSRGVFLRPSLKGISPTSMHFLKKHVMAVVRFMPISEKNSSASALRSSSMRMESVVVIADCPFCDKDVGIVSQDMCNVNAA